MNFQHALDLLVKVRKGAVGRRGGLGEDSGRTLGGLLEEGWRREVHREGGGRGEVHAEGDRLKVVLF